MRLLFKKQKQAEYATLNNKNAVDDAYKTKYNNSPYLVSMISNRAKGATVKIIPR